MPNLCYYEMRVKGKKESLEEFLDVMINYDRKKHFYRVFNADVYNEEASPDGDLIYSVCGDCAWSVYSCMCGCEKENPYPWEKTYCDEAGDNSTSLKQESARLELEIEVYSDEPGMAFQEHYHYKNGETLVGKCVDCVHYWWDRDDYGTFEECKEKNDWPEEITEDMVDENDECIVGGFGEWDFSF